MNEGYTDLSGPYTEDSSSKKNHDYAPKKHHVDMEPVGCARKTTKRPLMIAQERIKAYKDKVQKLKQGLEKEPF